ncbi:MAG: glycosyltransferase family 4 protein [Acidimicrobiales bacterium]
MTPDARPAAPTTVLIDASTLSSVGAKSGIGTYVRNLLASLASPPAGCDFRLSVNALVTPGVALGDGVGRRTIHRFVHQHARVEVIEHATTVPFDVLRWRRHGEVFHSPGFHAPPAIRGPWVQTLHDLIPIVLDDPDLLALRRRWQRFGPRYRKADAVVAVSRHAADEGIRLLHLDPQRVHVAHHGVDPQFRPAPPGSRPDDDPPFLLVVSEFSQRKGFDHAFAVISALADAGYPHRLKVAGQVHDFARQKLDGLRAAAGRPERIDLLGFVDDLPRLYQRASVVLVTSRYEGFGLPALEAMASVVPVIAYDNTAMTEVVTSGGILIPDGDVTAMTAAARRLLDDPEEAEEWRARGLVQAAKFTWADSAARHAEAYRAAAERPR